MTGQMTCARRCGIVVVAVLLASAGGRRLAAQGGGTAAAAQAAGAKEVQASFELYQAGRYQEAVVAANAALVANPNSADAYNNLAVAYMGLNRIDEAIAAARDAIRLRPDYQLARNNLAWFEREKAAAQAAVLLNTSLQHYQAQRFTECLDTALKAVTLNPKSAPALNNAAICAGNLQLWDEAIRHAREAIRLDPDFQLAKNNLAWVQQEKVKAAATKAR